MVRNSSASPQLVATVKSATAFEHLQRAHLKLGLAILAALIPAAGFIGEVQISTQLAIVALPIAILGVMHGALDPWVGDAVMRKQFGESRRAVFMASYILIMAAVVLAWATFPLITLTAFLALSVAHFGEQDAASLVGKKDGLGVVVFGAIPVFGPIVGHPGDVAVIFEWLIGIDAQRLESLLVWLVQPLVAVWLVGAGMLISRMMIEQTPRLGFCLFGLTTLVAAMLMLPPLVAFSAYFCLLHSFGHLIDLAARSEGPWKNWSLGQWTARLWPATLAALALGLAGWLALTEFQLTNLSARETLAPVIFCGLAALTVPHVLLHEIFRRQRSTTKRAS